MTSITNQSARMLEERLSLSSERIRELITEKDIAEPFGEYFRKLAQFIVFSEEQGGLLVSNGLMSKFQSTEFVSDDPAKVTGSLFATIPLFIFFLVFRKYIMRGVSRSGIKG